MKHRFPFPMLIETVQDGSQERFLTAKVNPSGSLSGEKDGEGGEKQNPGESAIFTEDVSFKVFMTHLKKLAVASS
jgi:protein transport protein SEC23